VQVEDLDISPMKISETVGRIVGRAVEKVERCGHAVLSTKHLFLALTQMQWDLFVAGMRGLEVNPQEIVETIEDIQLLPRFTGHEMRVSPINKLALKLTLHQTTRRGRHSIEVVDVPSPALEEMQGLTVTVIRGHFIDPDQATTCLNPRARDNDMRVERLKRRFELRSLRNTGSPSPNDN
jgi:hypothetical protein